MKIAITELREKILGTLTQTFPQEESIRIMEYILWAEMSGIWTQGISKMTGSEPIQNIRPKHAIQIERDTKLSQLINAGAHPSIYVSQIATDVVIDKAKQSGFGLVGIHNVFSSNGALAYYAERIAQKNFIGIVLARSPGSTAPFGSLDPLFGTNPIGFSFPTLKEPLVFDMATSAMTFYGLIIAKSRGESIPDNMAMNALGEPTNDPATAMDGALLPFDRSYKGSGLGMIVEILSGPLVAAGYCDYQTFDQEWGCTFIAIDPELLVNTEEFKTHCSDLIQIIRSSRRRDPNHPLRLPGDRAQACYRTAYESGITEVDRGLMEQLGYL